MLKRTILAALVVFGATNVTALADSCSGRSHATGSILGAVGGGLIGSAMTHGNGVGVVGGALAGGLAGNAIARDIDCNRGRHYDRHSHRYYWYSRHGDRVYEDRDARDHDRRHDRDDDRDRYR